MGNATIYKYLSFRDALKVILNRTIKFSRPYDFNDPFDCYEELIKFDLTEEFINEHIQKGILVLDDYEKSLSIDKLIQHLNKTYTFDNEVVKNTFRESLAQVWISCFSKSYNEILMWSHYGNFHTGICIGFNYLGLSKTFNFIPSEVQYLKRFMKIDYCSEKNKSINHLINSKSANWKYEQEIRLRTNNIMAPKLNEEGITPIHPDSISKIIIGCNCNIRLDSLRQRLNKLDYKDVDVIKLTKSRNSFGFEEIII